MHWLQRYINTTREIITNFNDILYKISRKKIQNEARLNRNEIGSAVKEIAVYP